VLQERKSGKKEGISAAGRKEWEGRKYKCCREERVGRKKV